MTIPVEMQPLLDDYIALLKTRLPDVIDACYIHGSIALRGFDAYSNDVDFVTILNRPCTPADIDTLTDIHHTLSRKYPQWIMDGCYLQWDDIGKADDAIAPYPHVNDHTLEPAGHIGMHGVMWWILKHHGIALVGTNPQALDIQIGMDDLLTRMYANLHNYWGQYTRHPRRILYMYTDDGIQWVVVGVLRQFYTFRERAITSKSEAGAYALHCLPHRWHRIIQEALNIRRKKSGSLYRWRIRRMWDAYYFLRYIIQRCDQYFT